MTKQDITRGLIEFAVNQCLNTMKEDPHRSIRRLADLGRQFAKGRFQERLFSLFQTLLTHEDSPYYDMIARLLSQADSARLKQFCINVGYNAWTVGAAKIRAEASANAAAPDGGCRTTGVCWLSGLDFPTDADEADRLCARIRQQRESGVYAYRLSLHPGRRFAGAAFFSALKDFSDCAFLLDFTGLAKEEPTAAEDEQLRTLLSAALTCRNLLLLLPFGPEWSLQLAGLILEKKGLFAVSCSYQDADVPQLLSPENIDVLSSWGSPLLIFSADKDCSAKGREAAGQAILDARLAQRYPDLLVDWENDIARIQSIITSSRPEQKG
ncbi:MAG: hypothetical protein Q4C65_06105 [Eubacteriales bacterium]|nr:hypothetical protein [Eubacteriales bacterium]